MFWKPDCGGQEVTVCMSALGLPKGNNLLGEGGWELDLAAAQQDEEQHVIQEEAGAEPQRLRKDKEPAVLQEQGPRSLL